MDVLTIVGLFVGMSCILLGQTLEGGHVGSIIQLTAAIIVLGGTAGAILTQFPMADLRRALVQTRRIFTSTNQALEPLIEKLVNLGRKSRREGLLVLEEEALQTPDTFLRQALLALVDGGDPAALRGTLTQIIDNEEEYQECGPQMFEAAGGYAPTLGILGAVLGLIHVMENLSDPSKLGSGIAVAFVATVYGVGSANMIFLPFASKLRMKTRQDSVRKELILEAACGIQEGLNPQIMERVEPELRGVTRDGSSPTRTSSR
jgi:chemotaxis protein MotA